METEDQGLQKFTNTEAKIDYLFALKRIEIADLEILDDAELVTFNQAMQQKFNSLSGIEQSAFSSKVEPIMIDGAKNTMWEYNHSQITAAIANLMQELGRMPSQTEIARKTELSRQTVIKHLKEYANHPLYLEQIEQFRFMTTKILANLFKYAVNGDVRAAKLYLTAMGVTGNSSTPNGSTLIQTQNNYIQVNGTVLSQDALNQLKPEQLNAIEEILKGRIKITD